MQGALDSGRLKYDEKAKSQMKIDSDPLQVAEANYVEPFYIGMVDISEKLNLGLTLEEAKEENTAVEEPDVVKEVNLEEVYPKAGETLVEFLSRSKDGEKEVMLCPRCSAVFDKSAAKAYQDSEMKRHYQRKAPVSRRLKYPHEEWVERDQELDGHKGQKTSSKDKTYLPNAGLPRNQWFRPTPPRPKPYPKWQKIDLGQGSSYINNSRVSRSYSYGSENYYAPEQMTRTQFRRFLRKRKAERERGGKFRSLWDIKPEDNSRNEPSVASIINQLDHAIKQGTTIPPNPAKEKGKDVVEDEDEDMLEDFDDSEGEELNIICIVSILPAEFDRISEVTESEEDYYVDDEPDDNPLCYYVMQRGSVEDERAIFQRPTEQMKSHLKPLFVWARVEEKGVNKVLVDGGAAINLMPGFMLKKLGKTEADLISHDMVLSDYEGKTGSSLEAIMLNITVGTVARSTLFIVVPSKANYNLLLGREWIHGVGAVPSTLHQRISIWKADGVVENVQADQSYYLAETSYVGKKNFEKSLATIAPLDTVASQYFNPYSEYSVTLDPIRGLNLNEACKPDAMSGWHSDEEKDATDGWQANDKDD